MSKKLQKSLQDYLTKIKSTSPNIQFPSKSVSSSKKWILKGCRHPKTLSFAVNHGHQGTNGVNNDDAATLADVDRFLFENFKSLYLEDDDEIEGRRCTVGSDDHVVRSSGGILRDPPRFMDPPSYLCGSNRFFVSTGSSSSLVDESRSSIRTNTTVSVSGNRGSTTTSSASINDATASDDSNSNGRVEGNGVTFESLSDIRNECIAVLTYSPNPYDDFRRSMEEIVEARLKHHSKIDWDFVEELVFCYLNLNDKKSHKFILSAFVDLVVDLRQNDMKIPVKSRHFKANTVRDHKKSRRTRHHVR
ncbi:ovate family protein 14 [Hibiscus trionum]|uniref:Transcription repressor n=1 Tax=Hibiscus trionum TaxID=183268 RepID=A0A9W7M8Z3_HIBTR|nr:ovate family protein 14 [Hibiscus trionum]